VAFSKTPGGISVLLNNILTGRMVWSVGERFKTAFGASFGSWATSFFLWHHDRLVLAEEARHSMLLFT